MNEDGSQSQPLADVFVTNAVRTSAGPGPGHKRLPADEASRLVAGKYAIFGTQPPRAYGDRLDTGLNGR